MRRTISPARFETEFDFAFACDFEALVTDRAADDVFDELMESRSIERIDMSIGVQRKAIDAEAQPAFGQRDFLFISKSGTDLGDTPFLQLIRGKISF